MEGWMWFEGVNGGGRFMRMDFYVANIRKSLFLPFGKKGIGFYRVGSMLRRNRGASLNERNPSATNLPDHNLPKVFTDFGKDLEILVPPGLPRVNGLNWYCGSSEDFANYFDLHKNGVHIWWSGIPHASHVCLDVVIKKMPLVKESIELQLEKSGHGSFSTGIGEDDEVNSAANRGRTQWGDIRAVNHIMEIRSGLESDRWQAVDVLKSGAATVGKCLEDMGPRSTEGVGQLDGSGNLFKIQIEDGGTAGASQLVSINQ